MFDLTWQLAMLVTSSYVTGRRWRARLRISASSMASRLCRSPLSDGEPAGWPSDGGAELGLEPARDLRRGRQPASQLDSDSSTQRRTHRPRQTGQGLDQ